MDITLFSKVCVPMLGGVGLLMSIRRLWAMADVDRWSDLTIAWNLLFVAEGAWRLAMYLVPPAFQLFCITTCFVQFRRPYFIASTVLLAIVAVPVFQAWQFSSPSVTRNALWTAIWWIPIFVRGWYGAIHDRPDASQSTSIVTPPRT